MSEARMTSQTLQSGVTLNLVSRWMFWATRGSLSILDQALIAASNFVIGILLARWLSPEEYGSYALAFSVFLLLSLSSQALLLEPQRVFGPSDYADSQREYLGILLWIHSGLALAILVTLGTAACLMHLLSRPDGLPGALAGATFAAPCVLLLWLARGACYVRMSPQRAVIGATAYCTVVFIALALVYKLNLLSPFSAFMIMGVAALTSSALLLVRLQPVLKRSMNGPSRTVVFQQHWQYGRWMLVGLVLSWISAEIYYPLLTIFSGAATAGVLKVLLNFNLPLVQGFVALSLFLLPYTSRLYHEKGVTALTGFAWRMTGLFTAAAIVYWAIAILLSRPLMQSLYGARYAEISSQMPLLAAASFPWNVAIVPTIVLRALRSSASIMGIYCACSGVAIVIGVPATKVFGIRGALSAMALSNLAALVVALALASRALRNAATT
jgi:O-antigen/teichoic acid export membrane protein